MKKNTPIQKDLTVKELNKIIEDIFKDKEHYPKHYVWEEDGIKYSAWEIAPGTMTGDGGMEMYDKALREELTKLPFKLEE